MSGIVEFKKVEKKEKNYFEGKESFETAMKAIFDKLGDEVDTLVLIVDLTKNRFDEKRVDIHVKNSYFYSGRNLYIIEGCKIKTIYKVFKTKQTGLKALVVANSGECLDYEINDDLTDKITTKEVKGKYGKFTSAFFKLSEINTHDENEDSESSSDDF